VSGYPRWIRMSPNHVAEEVDTAKLARRVIRLGMPAATNSDSSQSATNEGTRAVPVVNAAFPEPERARGMHLCVVPRGTLREW